MVLIFAIAAYYHLLEKYDSRHGGVMLVILVIRIQVPHRNGGY